MYFFSPEMPVRQGENARVAKFEKRLPSPVRDAVTGASAREHWIIGGAHTRWKKIRFFDYDFEHRSETCRQSERSSGWNTIMVHGGRGPVVHDDESGRRCNVRNAGGC